MPGTLDAMTLYADHDDCAEPFVDRTGTVEVPGGPEGFVVSFGGLTIRFADERDAAEIARRILRRLGELP